jgi:hypothetical protein
MIAERLELTAARFVFGSASAEEVVAVADELLCAGVYTYGLGELGTLRSPTTEEVRHWLRVALRDVNLAWPSFEEAAFLLVKAQMWALAENVRPAPEGLDQFWDECYRPVQWGPAERVVRVDVDSNEMLDLYRTARFNAALAEGGDLPNKEVKKARRELEAAVVRKAREWLRWHCRLRVDESWLRWNGGTVVTVADSIATDQALDRLPLLADALEDAGCTNADVLKHCRSRSPHGGYCWVVNLLRGEL